jgi:SagB-type dehydrogenase family enzyme
MNNTSKSFLDYHYNSSTRSKGAPPAVESWPEEWKTIYFKGYPRFDRIALPEAQFSSSLPLHKVMQARQSLREFAPDEPLTLEDLSRIMSGLQLISGFDSSAPDFRRPYASAGSRYPIEAYILPLRVQKLASHVFHYHVRSHSLEDLWPFSQQQFADCFPHDDWFGQAAAAIILTACHPRSTMKYGNRAYRFCLLEAGEIAQNIQLVCAAEQLASCSFGVGVDEAIMRLIDIDPNEELVMHVMFVGKPSSSSES